MIVRFSLRFLFTSNSTINPAPAPEQRPAMIEAKEMTPFKYNSVNKTDTAQFGIRPSNAAMNG